MVRLSNRILLEIVLITRSHSLRPMDVVSYNPFLQPSPQGRIDNRLRKADLTIPPYRKSLDSPLFARHY